MGQLNDEKSIRLMKEVVRFTDEANAAFEKRERAIAELNQHIRGTSATTRLQQSDLSSQASTHIEPSDEGSDSVKNQTAKASLKPTGRIKGKILDYLAQNPDLPKHYLDIAMAIGEKPKSISGFVSALVKEGLLVRAGEGTYQSTPIQTKSDSLPEPLSEGEVG